MSEKLFVNKTQEPVRLYVNNYLRYVLIYINSLLRHQSGYINNKLRSFNYLYIRLSLNCYLHVIKIVFSHYSVNKLFRWESQLVSYK